MFPLSEKILKKICFSRFRSASNRTRESPSSSRKIHPLEALKKKKDPSEKKPSHPFSKATSPRPPPEATTTRARSLPPRTEVARSLPPSSSSASRFFRPQALRQRQQQQGLTAAGSAPALTLQLRYTYTTVVKMCIYV